MGHNLSLNTLMFPYKNIIFLFSILYNLQKTTRIMNIPHKNENVNEEPTRFFPPHKP
jgi:hypothetical protein